MNGRCSDSGFMWSQITRLQFPLRGCGILLVCRRALHLYGDVFVSSCNIWEHDGLLTAECVAESRRIGRHFGRQISANADTLAQLCCSTLWASLGLSFGLLNLPGPSSAPPATRNPSMCAIEVGPWGGWHFMRV